MDKKEQINFWYVIAALLGVLFAQSLYKQYTQIESISYSQFQHYLEQGKVEEITITDQQIYGRLKTLHGKGYQEFITTRVDPELAEDLEKYGVEFSGIVKSTWLRDILSWLFPLLVFVGLWLFVIRRITSGVSGGMMSIGKSHAKVFVEKETKVTFDDVAGVDEAKEELIEIINFLKNPADYSRLGGRAPKGILLVGPPGTGKTLLARATKAQSGGCRLLGGALRHCGHAGYKHIRKGPIRDGSSAVPGARQWAAQRRCDAAGNGAIEFRRHRARSHLCLACARAFAARNNHACQLLDSGREFA